MKDIDALCSRYEEICKIISATVRDKVDCSNNIKEYIKKHGNFVHNGYIYYIKSEYTANIVSINHLKANYPEVYKQCIKPIKIKERLIRRLYNAK